MEDYRKHRERVRERVKRQGLDNMQDYEILEYLLFHSNAQKDTKPIAKELLRRFGRVCNVLDASYEDLCEVPGVGPASALLLRSLAQLSRYYDLDKLRDKPQIENFQEAGRYAAAFLKGEPYETFAICCLDIRRRVLGTEIIGRGTVDETPVYPRLAVETALRLRAHSCIAMHNHPGGTPYPSPQDAELTAQLREALRGVSIDLCDHIIVAEDRRISFANLRILSNPPVDYDIGLPPARPGAKKNANRAAANTSVMQPNDPT